MNKKVERNLLLGTIFTNIADSIFYIMTIWYFNEKFSSPIILALVFAVVSLIDVFSFLFGPFIDRTGPKVNLLYISIFQTTCILGLTVLIFLNKSNSIHATALVILLALVYMGSTIIYPSGEKLIPIIANDDRLLKVNSLFKTSEKILDIFFNAISTILVTFISFHALVVIILAFFAVSIRFYYIVSHNIIELTNIKISDNTETYSPSEYWQDLKTGIIEIKSHIEILRLFIPLIFVNLFYGIAIIVLPIVSKLYISTKAYGYGSLLICSSIGGVVGSFLVSRISDGLNRPSKYTSLCLFLAGISWIGMTVALSNCYWLSFIFIFISNGAISVMNIIFVSLIQKEIDVSLLGRVSTFTESIVSIMIPIGNFLGGILVTFLSPVMAELLYGMALVFGALPYLLLRSNRKD
ncbi:MAG: MFS transporter [Lachnospiraceae bacterium]|nr:MFS transporter [Lachnospiraceae bacterium]